MKLNNQEIKEGYKVVSYELLAPRYFSYTRLLFKDSVEYKINEWTQPKQGCGPLAVFKNIDEAIKFQARQTHAFKIFKCFYVPSEYEGLWTTESKQIIRDKYCPLNTDFADAVYLIEEVNES